MIEKILHCYHCNHIFNSVSVHSGFGDEFYFYCNTCGAVATVGWYDKEMIDGNFFKKFVEVEDYNKYKISHKIELIEKRYEELKKELVKHIKLCLCGGKFTTDAIPRCPLCLKELDWINISEQLDRETIDEPIANYWRKFLEKNWHDIYYFIFNKKIYPNNWLGRNQANSPINYAQDTQNVPHRNKNKVQSYKIALYNIELGMDNVNIDPKVFGQKAELLGKIGKLEEGLGLVEENLKKYPENAYLLFVKAMLVAMKRDKDNMLVCLKKVSELNPLLAKCAVNEDAFAPYRDLKEFKEIQKQGEFRGHNT